MYDLKQSTALTVLFFAHDANGDAVNSLADGTWTKRISKNGGSFNAMTVTISFLENGWYSLPLTTAHTDTIGVLTMAFTNAGCKQVNMQYRVHARINDDLAPASTALTNATWTDAKAAFLDAAVTSRMATYTQPTGFLSATFPGGTLANTTNITAGTITTVGTVNALAGDSVTAAALAADAGTEIGDAVWAITSALSGKTYGLLIAEMNAAQIIRVGQCQAGSTTQAIVLDASASAVDDFYNRTTITFATGTAAGQNRLINDYDGATKTAYLDRPLLVGAPALNNWFAIDSRGNTRSASDLRIGLAQAGGASTITLQATESASNDFFNRMFILIESGTGEGQARLIDDYDGASKVATVARAWVVQPDNTSRYVILPFGSVKVSDIDADAVNASALAADAVAEIAAGILVTPANKLATDANGYVTEASVDGIKKNTALANFEFLMVDSTDHVTAKTGLTVTSERSIDGAAFGACANSAAEVGSGIYKIDLAASDLNGDVITFKFTASGADARFITVKTNE